MVYQPITHKPVVYCLNIIPVKFDVLGVNLAFGDQSLILSLLMSGGTNHSNNIESSVNTDFIPELDHK